MSDEPGPGTALVALVVWTLFQFGMGHYWGREHTRETADDWQRRYEAEARRNDECIIQGPPLCYDHWTRITVPTCDGGMQTLEAR